MVVCWSARAQSNRGKAEGCPMKLRPSHTDGSARGVRHRRKVHNGWGRRTVGRAWWMTPRGPMPRSRITALPVRPHSVRDASTRDERPHTSHRSRACHTYTPTSREFAHLWMHLRRGRRDHAWCESALVHRHQQGRASHPLPAVSAINESPLRRSRQTPQTDLAAVIEPQHALKPQPARRMRRWRDPARGGGRSPC